MGRLRRFVAAWAGVLAVILLILRFVCLSPFMTKASLIESAVVLALLLALLLGYRYFDRSPLLADVELPLDAACDLQQGPCSVALPQGGRLRLELSPRPVKVMSSLSIGVEVLGAAQAAKVLVDFAGVDMNMGFNRPQLDAVGDGRFSGETMLPACVTGRMTWRATVLLESDGRRVAAPFHFDAGRTT